MWVFKKNKSFHSRDSQFNLATPAPMMLLLSHTSVSKEEDIHAFLHEEPITATNNKFVSKA